MIEEFNNQIEKINNFKYEEIDKQLEESQKGLLEMQKGIDNIIFCCIQKEMKKNDKLLLKTNLDNSNEIAMMRTLTDLNILPILPNNNKNNEINERNKDNTNTEENKYLYFLLSKTKSKNITGQLNPFDFWKYLLKFNGLGKSN